MSDDLYYVQDTRQVVGNCLMWWRKGNNGYTAHLDEAAIFTLEEAQEICQNRASDKMYEITHINGLAHIHVDIQDIGKEAQ